MDVICMLATERIIIQIKHNRGVESGFSLLRHIHLFEHVWTLSVLKILRQDFALPGAKDHRSMNLTSSASSQAFYGCPPWQTQVMNWSDCTMASWLMGVWIKGQEKICHLTSCNPIVGMTKITCSYMFPFLVDTSRAFRMKHEMLPKSIFSSHFASASASSTLWKVRFQHGCH